MADATPSPETKPANLAETASGDPSPPGEVAGQHEPPPGGDGGDTVMQPPPKKHEANPRVKEFAALTRKEREVRAAMQQQKQAMAEVEQFKRLASEAKKNPDAVLKMLGLTYDDVTNHYVKGGQDSPEGRIQGIQERLTDTEKRLDEALKQLEQREQSKLVSEFVGEIKKIVDSSDEFELVRAYEAYDDVYQLIDLHYQKTGEILDKSEAAERVERVLLQHKEAEAQKLSGIKKLKAKLGVKGPEDSKESAVAQPQPAATPTKTITNDLVAAATSPKPTRKLTEDEEWALTKGRHRVGAKQPTK